jgi:hypothetical protein
MSTQVPAYLYLDDLKPSIQSLAPVPGHFAARHFAERYFAERHFAERHFAERHFAERHFTERTFRRTDILPTDILPNGLFAEKTFCRTDNLPKIEMLCRQIIRPVLYVEFWSRRMQLRQ